MGDLDARLGVAQVALAFAVLGIGNASDLGFVFVAREIPMVAFLLHGAAALVPVLCVGGLSISRLC